MGGLGFEAVEDDGQGEQAGDLQSKRHDEDLCDGEYRVVGHGNRYYNYNVDWFNSQ